MKIDMKENEGQLEISLIGRLDTNTSPQLEEELKKVIVGLPSLVIDMGGLEYISSAGLRVLLSAHKAMKKQGNMLLKNVREEVLEIFNVTGFSEILDIEK